MIILCNCSCVTGLLLKSQNEHMSCVFRIPAFAYANTKAQLSRSAADQHLCFCYIDISIIPLLPKSEISSL